MKTFVLVIAKKAIYPVAGNHLLIARNQPDTATVESVFSKVSAKDGTTSLTMACFEVVGNGHYRPAEASASEDDGITPRKVRKTTPKS